MREAPERRSTAPGALERRRYGCRFRSVDQVNESVASVGAYRRRFVADAAGFDARVRTAVFALLDRETRDGKITIPAGLLRE